MSTKSRILHFLQQALILAITACNVLLSALAQYEQQTNSSMKGASLAINVICSILCVVFSRSREIVDVLDQKFELQSQLLTARGASIDISREPIDEGIDPAPAVQEEEMVPVKVFVNKNGELSYAPITPRR